MYTYNKGIISVIIPCYNGKMFINRCMDALLNQTYKKLEIIVVNDGSTDNSLELLNSYNSQFEKAEMIYKIINQENAGPSVAVNNALKIATGEFLVWQDIDDFYESNGLETLKKYLDDNKEVNFVRGALNFYYEGCISKPFKIGRSENPKNNNIFDAYIFHKDAYNYCGIFIARFEYFDRCVENREIQISDLGQNLQLILPMAYYGDCVYIDEIVYNKVENDNSHSRVNRRTYRDAINRFTLLEELLQKILDKIGIYEEYKDRIKQYCLEKN